MGKNKLIKITLFLIFAIAIAGCNHGSDWDIYRGNLERTGYSTDNKLPSGQFDWKFKADYEFLSSPVISQGMIFVNGTGGYVYAIDENSGQRNWIFNRQKSGGGSPVISNGIVYVGGFDHFLCAINAKTGKEKWRFETGDMIISSPAISEGIVYFGSYDGYLYAVNADTGQEKWKFKTQGRKQPFSVYDAEADYEIVGAIGSSPAIVKRIVYFESHDGYLYALDAKTGVEKWKFNVGAFTSGPAVSDGLIYVGSSDGYLYAIKDNGQLKWKIKIQDLASVSSAAIANGIVYFSSSYEYQNHNDYYIYAVETKTGQSIWKIQLSSNAHELTIANNVLYFGDDNGIVFALDAKSAKELWKFKADSAIYSEVVIAYGKAYFSTKDGYLYSLR